MKSVSNKKQEMRRKDIPIHLPQRNHFSSREAWEISCWKNIVKSETLLHLLITPHEQHNLVIRATTLEGLMSGKSYKQIGKELWASPQTISGIKKAMEERIYESYLERRKKKQKEEKNTLPPFQHYQTKKRSVRTKFGRREVSF